MLKFYEDWHKIEESHCLQGGQLVNLQPIKERLLRLATKWADFYASDIIIFFENFDKYFLEDDVVEIDLYFRNSGIEWVTLNTNGETRACLGVPDNYRGQAKLTFDGKDMVLYWQIGNC